MAHAAEYLPVTLQGQSYAVDPLNYRRTTVPVLREQFDQSAEAGEQRLNSQMWVRRQTDWSYGAGQDFLDNDDSDPRRFKSSSGVDVWTKGRASVLPLCETKNNANVWTDIIMRRCGDYLYVADGSDLYFSLNFANADTSVTWTPVTAHAGGAFTITDVTTDGTTIFIAYGAANPISETGIGSATAPTNMSGVPLNPDWVRLVGGRLMSADANVLSELAADGSAAGLSSTLPHAGATWVTACAGPVGVYAAANDDTGSIHYVPIASSDGLLDTAQQVAELPRGETINDMIAYGGFVVLATSKGLRVAAVDTQSGGLTYGPVIDDGGQAWCLAADDRFVWWGSASGQVYRADLSVFTDTLVPAWASDLLSVGDGNALGNVTYLARQAGATYFVDEGNGVQGEESTGVLVAAGTLDCGDVRWNSQFDKRLRTVEVRSSPDVVAAGNITYNDASEAYNDATNMFDGEGVTVAGTVQVQFTTDTGLTSDLQTLTDKTETVVTPTLNSDRFGVEFTLNRDGTETTAGPSLESWMIQAFPAPTRIDEIVLPIGLGKRVATSRGMGAALTQDPQAIYDTIRALMTAKTVCTLEEGSRSESVVVDQMSLEPAKLDSQGDWWEGTLTIRLLTVPGAPSVEAPSEGDFDIGLASFDSGFSTGFDV